MKIYHTEFSSLHKPAGWIKHINTNEETNMNIVIFCIMLEIDYPDFWLSF